MDRVDALREQIRDQRVVVGDRLEAVVVKARGTVMDVRSRVEDVRDRLNLRERARIAIGGHPLPYLAGGLAVGFVIGLSAPDMVRGLVRFGWGAAKIGVRLGGPLALFAIAAGERERRLERRRGEPRAPRLREGTALPVAEEERLAAGVPSSIGREGHIRR
jgi:hypothetical protein